MLWYSWTFHATRSLYKSGKAINACVAGLLRTLVSSFFPNSLQEGSTHSKTYMESGYRKSKATKKAMPQPRGVNPWLALNMVFELL